MYSKNSEGMETNNKTMHPFFSNTKRPRKNRPFEKSPIRNETSYATKGLYGQCGHQSTQTFVKKHMYSIIGLRKCFLLYNNVYNFKKNVKLSLLKSY